MAIPGIQEIQALATKYSKPQLQKMAQMGLIDPTKAVMAGMMIDRIQKQNSTPPEQTVAEEVMGGAPEPVPAGIAGLPSNLPEQMAGGGIVALADGGDVEGYAGGGPIAFADRGLVDARTDPSMRIDPRVQAARDLDRYAILAEELRDAERRLAQGDPRAQGDIEALRREMRSIKPAPSAGGVAALLPSAQAETMAPPAPAGTTQEERDRAAIAGGFQDFMSGARKLGAAAKDVLSLPGRAVAGAAESAITRPLRAAGVDIPYLPESFYGGDRSSMTPYMDALRKEEAAALPPIRKPEKKKEAGPTSFESKVSEKKETPPPKEEEEPMEEVRPAMGPPEATFADRLRNLGMPEPAERSMQDIIKEQEEAESAMGVDKELFNRLREDYAATKGKLKDRANKAAGHALMMFGAGLLGGTRGNEWQNASKSAQQALMMYMSNMDKITDNEERINQAMRELSVSEEQYKRNRSDRALARLQANRDKIDQVRLENAKLEATAEIKAAEFAVDVIKNENPAMWKTLENIAQEQRARGNKKYTTLDALRDYQSSSGTGAASISPAALADKAYDNVMKRAQVDIAFQMRISKDPAELQAAIAAETRRLQGGGAPAGGAPAGGAAFNYVPGKGLVPNQ